MFAWISNVDDIIEVINIFNSTTLICNQKVDPGIFALTSKIIFYVHGKSYLKEITKIIFSHKLIQGSPYVAIAKESTMGSISFYSLDFFRPTEHLVGPISLTHVWTITKPVSSLNTIYTDRKDFMGHSIKVGAMPVSHCVVAEPISTDDPSWSNITQFKGHFGFEIEILQACSKVLNFTYELFNSAVFEYFFVSEDNSYTGLMGDVARGSFDVSIGACIQNFEANQLLDNSITFDQEAYDFASPIPKEVSKIFAIVHPFPVTVWLLLMVTFVTIILTFTFIALVQEKVHIHGSRRFSNISHSFLFCLRTILIDSEPELHRTTTSSSTIRLKGWLKNIM